MPMKTINLTKGKIVSVDDTDFDWLNQWKWCVSSEGYAKRANHINNRWITVYMHRAILGVENDVTVDHIDGNPLNNCRINLRKATNKENCRNQKLSMASHTGLKGVCWDKTRNKWLSHIKVDGKFISLGRFTCPVLAAQYYDAACVKYFGCFAKTN